MATGEASGQPRPSVGVFFVHGIGEQQRGDTLVTWADAVIEFLEGSLGEDAVELSAAQLTSDPDEPSAPAFLDVFVTLPGGAGPVRWRLAEGWWAHVFGPPSFRELSVWAFLSLPYTILSHVVTGFHRAWKAGGGWPLRAVRTTVRAVGVLVAVLLAPLMTLAVGTILLVGVLPISRLRRVAGALQRSLSQSVGDSYVLLGSPVRAAAIVHTVRRDLEWLTCNADEVIVVAHSQGAEVAHRAVRHLAGSNIRRLITVGSGQTKLFMAARAGQLGSYRGVWFAPAGMLVVILSILVGLQTWSQQGSGAIWSMLLVVFIGIGLFAVGIQHAGALGRPSDAQLDSGASDGWLDLYASHDPVPNGPLYLLGERKPIFTSRQVRNRASVLRDHSAYVRNVEQVIAVIAEAGALASGRSFGEPAQEHEGDRVVAALRRSWRVAWLRVAKWVAVTGGLAIAARTWVVDDSAGPDVLRPVVSTLEKLLSVDVPSTWTQGEELTAAAAITFGGATAVIGYLVFAAMWVWWEKGDRSDFYSRSEASLVGDYRFPLWAPGYVALLEAMAAFATVVGYVVAGGASPRVRDLSMRDWAQVFLIPVLVWVVALLVGKLLSWPPQLLEKRRLLIEPGRGFPTPPQQLAVMVPYTGALIGSSVLTMSAPVSGSLLFVLLMGPLLLLYLVTPFLSSSRLVRTALLPLRAKAYAPPREPPTTPYLKAVRLHQLLAHTVQPALDDASRSLVTDSAPDRIDTLAGALRRYPHDGLEPGTIDDLEQVSRLLDEALTDADVDVVAGSEPRSAQLRVVCDRVREATASLEHTIERLSRPELTAAL